MAWRLSRRTVRRIQGDLLKPAATAINSLILLGLVITFDRPTAITMFFGICLGMDLMFGRCVGMMICRTQWVGKPRAGQKLIYNASYVICFDMMLYNAVLALIVGAAQIVSVVVTGKTTHGLLAGMNSERL